MSKRSVKSCNLCGTEFLSWRNSQLFCSKSCRMTGSGNTAYKHGQATRAIGQSKEYRTWSGIKQRTANPHRMNAFYYQDRGIGMCESWRNSFLAFVSDMGDAPSARHSIERIDNNKGYEPGNCRWATQIEQMQNTRRSRRLTYQGRTMTQEEWGRITGIGGTAICKRLRRGWSVEKSLTTPKAVSAGRKT